MLESQVQQQTIGRGSQSEKQLAKRYTVVLYRARWGDDSGVALVPAAANFDELQTRLLEPRGRRRRRRARLRLRLWQRTRLRLRLRTRTRGRCPPCATRAASGGGEGRAVRVALTLLTPG